MMWTSWDQIWPCSGCKRRVHPGKPWCLILILSLIEPRSDSQHHLRHCKTHSRPYKIKNDVSERRLTLKTVCDHRQKSNLALNALIMLYVTTVDPSQYCWRKWTVKALFIFIWWWNLEVCSFEDTEAIVIGLKSKSDLSILYNDIDGLKVVGCQYPRVLVKKRPRLVAMLSARGLCWMIN